MIQRRPVQLYPPRSGRGRPTSRRSPAWSTGPRPGSRRPTPGRCPPTRPRPRTGAPPRRRSRPRPVAAASTTPPPDPRTACAGCAPAAPHRRLGQLGEHLLRAAQILLGHDPRLALHPRGFHQVVVGLLAAALPHDRRHIWVIHSSHTNLKHHNPRHAGQLRRPETPASRTSSVASRGTARGQNSRGPKPASRKFPTTLRQALKPRAETRTPLKEYRTFRISALCQPTELPGSPHGQPAPRGDGMKPIHP